jgi:hypothetical protein
MRSALSLACLIGAIAATCVFLGPGFQVSINDDGTENRIQSTHYMGFPLSPWWDYRKVTVNDEVTESDFNLHISSASWLILLVAILLFIAWHKLGSASRDSRKLEL